MARLYRLLFVLKIFLFIAGRSTKTKDLGGLLTWRPSLLNIVGGRDRSDSGESGASAATVTTLNTEVKSLGPGPDLGSELEIEIWVRREQSQGAEVLRRAAR